MPDLGKYADAVLGAYAVSAVLLVGIVLISVIRARRVKAELEALEQRQKTHG